MKHLKYKSSGTVAVGIALLIIVVLVVLSIVRYFWVDSANEYFEGLISVYIFEKEDFNADDREQLRIQLLEDGLFIKMHRWNKESFIKDRKLYDDMLLTRDRRQMRIDEERGSVIDTMINL
jgi:hypothetical protein